MAEKQHIPPTNAQVAFSAACAHPKYQSTITFASFKCDPVVINMGAPLFVMPYHAWNLLLFTKLIPPMLPEEACVR